MRLIDFKSEAEEHIHSLRKLFEKLPEAGLKEEDSQRVCLLNSLADLQSCVNGTAEADLDGPVRQAVSTLSGRRI